MRALYSLLLLLARPLVHVRLWWRARQTPAYGERRAERFGHVPASVPRGVVWVHTVSAGETIAAAPLIRALAAQLGSASDEPRLLVTTMTPTGSDEVARLFGSTVAHCYAPYDFVDAVQRFVDRVEPVALIVMETEIWPNMIRLTADRNVPVALVNARLSARSARGYGRVLTLVQPVLRRFAWIACQYPADAERFRTLGVSPAQIEVTGSVKFDIAEQPDSDIQVAQLERLTTTARLSERRVWIAGSTHAGEDEIVLAAHKQLLVEFPDLLLILVPRHPERFTAVAQLAADQLPSQRLSKMLVESGPSATAVAESTQTESVVLVADVMGLLRPLYGVAHVAFIGGSLVDLGGHNPIEAAVAGVPMVMGPGRYNFAGVCELFAKAGCLQLATDASELVATVGGLMRESGLRAEQGQRAQILVAENAGATQRLLTRLTGLVGAAGLRGEGRQFSAADRPDGSTS